MSLGERPLQSQILLGFRPWNSWSGELWEINVYCFSQDTAPFPAVKHISIISEVIAERTDDFSLFMSLLLKLPINQITY